MAGLRQKVEAESEQVDQALRELPGSRRLQKLSVLELAGMLTIPCLDFSSRRDSHHHRNGGMSNGNPTRMKKRAKDCERCSR